MEKYTRTSSSTSQHEAQYHSIINASHPDSTSKRRRLSTRRKLALLLVALSFALFCVLLFPVYFTLPRYHHGSSGTSLNSSSTSTVVAAQSATTSGAVRKQAVKFTDLNDFRIEYYSSGQNNSKVLKGGLPGNVWSGSTPGSLSGR
ncbi:hypothetical protein [Sporisorium scitamineum]|uniref:Uncharacterized protein n=1 Tax=Sporisorium scitamineum TaxID=49012 RepID=A0A0F7S7E4_9BASI|nr:hypothetical protein [Sporisorium scitamineum]